MKHSRQLSKQLQTWVRQATDGDKEAENHLCRHFIDRYKSYFQRRGYSQQDVDDASQEAAISLLSALRAGRIDSATAISSYFFSAFKFQIWRSQRITKRYATNTEWEKRQFSVQGCFEKIASIEKIKNVKKAIAQLKKERDRQLLTRRFFNDETIDQLCEEFQMARPHFYRVLHRARNRLNALMA